MIPLVYIYRNYTVINAAIQAGPFRDMDHEYQEAYVLQGVVYSTDSKKHYKILNPLLIGDPA